MFFLARSAFCIGLVAYLLPASEGAPSWQGLAEGAEMAATNRLETLCGASPAGCAEVEAAKLLLMDRIGTPRSASGSRSISTLAGSDFVPTWSNPAPRP